MSIAISKPVNPQPTHEHSLPSEVLPLTWAHVDVKAKTVRLEPGETKNAEGRTLPYELLPELADLIDAQWQEHERLKKAGTICPAVFHRAGEPVKDFRKAWATAREAAGYPGRLPGGRTEPCEG